MFCPFDYDCHLEWTLSSDCRTVSSFYVLKHVCEHAMAYVHLVPLRDGSLDVLMLIIEGVGRVHEMSQVVYCKLKRASR